MPAHVVGLHEVRALPEERTVGWRIDHVFASQAAMRFVKSACLCPEVRGSDPCPVGVERDPAVRE